MSKILIQADYSKAETWVVASLADDATMISDLKNGNFHADNASNILGKKVTKDMYGDYQLGKKVGHGCCPGETEILTVDHNWVRMDEYTPNMQIRCIDRDTYTTFPALPSEWTAYRHTGKMYRFKYFTYEQYVTPNHRMPYRTEAGIPREMPASEFYTQLNTLSGYVETEKANVSIKDITASVEQYDSMVYCPTVPKGAFWGRYKGKISIFLNSNYGMTPFLLQSILAKDGYSYSKEETASLMERYHQRYVGIRSCYHQGIDDSLKRDMTLTNPFGRKITFWDFWGTRLNNKAFAWIPQSTIGDMTNTALVNVYEQLSHYVDLRLQCHDSLVMQINQEDLTLNFLEDLQRCMSFPLTVKNTTFTVPIDIEVGMNWYEMSEIYVKEGEIWTESKPEHLVIGDWLKSKGL